VREDPAYKASLQVHARTASCQEASWALLERLKRGGWSRLGVEVQELRDMKWTVNHLVSTHSCSMKYNSTCVSGAEGNRTPC
jgi:hypothetical protein